MSDARDLPAITRVPFAGGDLALVREEHVRVQLGVEQALGDLRSALARGDPSQAVNCPRVRVTPGPQGEGPWLHTLRAGLYADGLLGGKDYVSAGFELKAMWATVVDGRSGRLLALVEADYLSRMRTAATVALATLLLAPPDVTCLAHFGAGHISELLVRALLFVRPSLRRVLVVRRDARLGLPPGLQGLQGVAVEPAEAGDALEQADIVTTATSSVTPVIASGTATPRLRHLNLVGSNHIKRREIPADLAARCLPEQGGFLAADDSAQAALEAGDFAGLAVDWASVPTLHALVREPALSARVGAASLTAFKSVGIGLADLALAAGVCRRLGL